jgi:xylulokinase
MAGLATSGTLTHWFRDHCARELDPDVAFATLAAEAASVPPGADGLLFLPYFSGERTPIHDPHAKGCWFGLNLTHTRAHLYRALLEGIAFGVNHVAETYAGAGAKPARLYAVGGGVKNDVWVQAISDVTGLDQIVRRRTVGASYGDALLARIALGEADETELERWNPVERTVSARPTPAYEVAYPLFRRLYEQTKDVMRDLTTK